MNREEIKSKWKVDWHELRACSQAIKNYAHTIMFDQNRSYTISMLLRSLYVYYCHCSSNTPRGRGGHLNITWREGAHFLRISTTRLGKKFCISIPSFEIIRLQRIPKTIGKTIIYCSWKQQRIVLEQIVITCFGISEQFSYPVQEFMLKNDTLKNGTSRIGLYGSASPRSNTHGLVLMQIIYKRGNH